MGTKHLGAHHDPVCTCQCEGCNYTGHCGVDYTGCHVVDGLDEIYCGPMDDVIVGFMLAYGEHRGEIVHDKVKAGALAINYNVPLVSENRTVDDALAMLGDCGALIEMSNLLFTENAL